MEQDKLLTTTQVCQLLGIHINILYNYIHSKKLKAYKIGEYNKHGHWRIKESELKQFIESGVNE